MLAAHTISTNAMRRRQLYYFIVNTLRLIQAKFACNSVFYFENRQEKKFLLSIVSIHVEFFDVN